MSCRVLGRGMEQATLNLLVDGARALGAETLLGRYRPTAKNGMVSEHYARLGFEAVAPEGNETLWRLDLARCAPLPHHIETIAE